MEPTVVWTDERIAGLVRLWNEGLTTGEIGKRLDVSKNAVVGKAHRLGLTGRPSPIKRSGVVKKEDHRIRSVVELSATTCRWPIGDPKEPDFHFCGKRILTGKPYCAEHAAIAYVTSGKNRKDDAA
ncbi:MAG: global cell cycle regulator GcrA-like protein [Alphaproteobacteria bacterium]|nr:global cell cycle regulator GcrA-like protein [Alphaproteobacteria bacterium]